jgi:predicted DNA-binding transcriptional regulator AlpA
MPTERKRQMSDTAAIALLGISRRTFYRFLKDGTIAAPVGRLGKNRRGWTAAEIEVARSQMERKEKS